MDIVCQTPSMSLIAAPLPPPFSLVLFLFLFLFCFFDKMSGKEREIEGKEGEEGERNNIISISHRGGRAPPLSDCDTRQCSKEIRNRLCEVPSPSGSRLNQCDHLWIAS
jgi:hypothetical protein